MKRDQDTGLVSITPTSKVSIGLLVLICGSLFALVKSAWGFGEEISTTMVRLGERVEHMADDIGDVKDVLVKQDAYSTENAVRIGHLENRVDVLNERIAFLGRRVDELEGRAK